MTASWWVFLRRLTRLNEKACSAQIGIILLPKSLGWKDNKCLKILKALPSWNCKFWIKPLWHGQFCPKTKQLASKLEDGNHNISNCPTFKPQTALIDETHVIIEMAYFPRHALMPQIYRSIRPPFFCWQKVFLCKKSQCLWHCFLHS